MVPNSLSFPYLLQDNLDTALTNISGLPPSSTNTFVHFLDLTYEASSSLFLNLPYFYFNVLLTSSFHFVVSCSNLFSLTDVLFAGDDGGHVDVSSKITTKSIREGFVMDLNFILSLFVGLV